MVPWLPLPERVESFASVARVVSFSSKWSSNFGVCVWFKRSCLGSKVWGVRTVSETRTSSIVPPNLKAWATHMFVQNMDFCIQLACNISSRTFNTPSNQTFISPLVYVPAKWCHSPAVNPVKLTDVDMFLQFYLKGTRAILLSWCEELQCNCCHSR